jgi:hypothetical protein
VLSSHGSSPLLFGPLNQPPPAKSLGSRGKAALDTRCHLRPWNGIRQSEAAKMALPKHPHCSNREFSLAALAWINRGDSGGELIWDPPSRCLFIVCGGQEGFGQFDVER